MEELKHFTIPLAFEPMARKQSIYELLLWCLTPTPTLSFNTQPNPRFDIDFTGSGADVTIPTGPKDPDTHWHQVTTVSQPMGKPGTRPPTPTRSSSCLTRSSWWRKAPRRQEGWS